MENTNEIKKKINELRIMLNSLITNKKSLQDPEVVDISRKLDNLLNELDKFNIEEKK